MMPIFVLFIALVLTMGFLFTLGFDLMDYYKGETTTGGDMLVLVVGLATALAWCVFYGMTH